jgi:hypothetical protein
MPCSGGTLKQKKCRKKEERYYNSNKNCKFAANLKLT